MTTPEPAQTAPVRFATVRLAGSTDGELPLDVSNLLRASLVAGQTVTRHGKTWRLGQLLQLKEPEGGIASRVGFEDLRTTTNWDSEINDFVDLQVPDGSATSFVIDVVAGRIAYQAARSTGVLTALQALLNEAGQARWRIERVLNRETWDGWRTAVSRITKLNITVRRPNPNYLGRERLQAVMEGSHAGLIKMVLSAAPGDLEGLDIEEEFLKQVLAHAQLGYGSFKAEGEEVRAGREVDVRFDSVAQGAERVEEVPVGEDGLVSTTRLSEVLSTVDGDALTEAVDDDDPDT